MLDFFNNGTVAAFFGAFFAFLLVILNDWRRRNKKKNFITKIIEANKLYAKKKRQAIQNELKFIKAGQLLGVKQLQFSVEDISQVETEVYDLLKPEQKMALDVIKYTMESIDELVNQNATVVERARTEAVREISNQQLLTIKENFESALNNMDRLDNYLEQYLREDYQEIVKYERREKIKNS